MASDTAHRFEICKTFAKNLLAWIWELASANRGRLPHYFAFRNLLIWLERRRGYEKKRDTAFGDSSQKAIAWRDRGERFLFTIARMFQHWTFKKKQTKLSWRAELSVGWKFSGNIARVLTCTKKRTVLSVPARCWGVLLYCMLSHPCPLQVNYSSNFT